MAAVYKLTPAYRHGQDTPWGGDGLRRVFGKEIPDDRTGESLEASTLPGLQSRTQDGRTLTEVAGGPLPLLLKLLDAREALSVQVHPDDAYAGLHENGKLGKTEAWLILHAEPGAKLVYGLLPETDMTRLAPQNIEAHLRWIPVKEGDVLFIPAGMVHAIGPGILLYEIQQSSDVTYRFWDWDRRDAQGNPRALHWRKACDVARPDLQLGPVTGKTKRMEGGLRTRYLDTAFFTLDRLSVEGYMPLPAGYGFQFITALGTGLLHADGETIPFMPGDTCFIPAGQEGIAIQASCSLLVSGQGGA